MVEEEDYKYKAIRQTVKSLLKTGKKPTDVRQAEFEYFIDQCIKIFEEYEEYETCQRLIKLKNSSCDIK